ncbi:unnamed protein product [Sympodiomycopsis kandeliae]
MTESTSQKDTSLSDHLEQGKDQHDKTKREQMHWKGVLSEKQLQELKDGWGDVIVCPGYTARFGTAADSFGRVYLPGAAVGAKETRKRLRIWKEKTDHDVKYNWWIEKMQHSNIEPITVAQILDELPLRQWQEYSARYKKAVSARNKATTTRRRIEATIAQAKGDTSTQAAQVLASLKDAPDSGVENA